MKNALFLLFLFIGLSSYSQPIQPKDSIKLSFTAYSTSLSCVMNINYWVYQSNKSYYNYSLRSLTPSIKFGFKDKKLYIRRDYYFYYRERGKTYKFIF